MSRPAARGEREIVRLGGRGVVLAMPPARSAEKIFAPQHARPGPSSSPAEYALRTPTRSAMFGRAIKGVVASGAIAIRSKSETSGLILFASAFAAALVVREPDLVASRSQQEGKEDADK